MATSAERLAEYERLFDESQSYNVPKYQQDFEKAYGEKTNYNKDIIDQQSNALGQLQAVAPEMRQRYSQTLIKDPTLQRSLIAQARQTPISQYSSAVNILGQRGQRMSDILSQATAGYQTAAQQAQTAAENQWRLYQDQLQQEQAARAMAASQGPSLDDILKGIFEQGGDGTGSGDSFEIPVDDYEGAPQLTNSYQDRLAQRVLDQRQAEGFGDTFNSYLNSSLEPYRNLKSIGDVASIPTRALAAGTTQISDLFNRLFKR